MILALTALLNSILSYFNIDLYILNVDCKIIESAIVFWFMDDDYQYEKKVEKFYMN